jgi:hypothetical protein
LRFPPVRVVASGMPWASTSTQAESAMSGRS